MMSERDALEVLVSLIYLIDKHAQEQDKVLFFVRQSETPLRILIDHFSEPAADAQ